MLDLTLECPLLLTDQKQLVLHAVTSLRECNFEVLKHRLVQRGKRRLVLVAHRLNRKCVDRVKAINQVDLVFDRIRFIFELPDELN